MVPFLFCGCLDRQGLQHTWVKHWYIRCPRAHVLPTLRKTMNKVQPSCARVSSPRRGSSPPLRLHWNPPWCVGRSGCLLRTVYKLVQWMNLVDGWSWVLFLVSPDRLLAIGSSSSPVIWSPAPHNSRWFVVDWRERIKCLHCVRVQSVCS